METMKRIAHVTAKAPWTLRITWHDGTKDVVDLTGLVHRSRHFARFLDAPRRFREVRTTEYGGGVEWPNGLDYGADTLAEMADEQRPLKGSDLVRFEKAQSLSAQETAALLDIAPRTVRAYRSVKRLPQPIAVTIRLMEKNSTVLAAHYKPVAPRPKGRPAKAIAR